MDLAGSERASRTGAEGSTLILGEKTQLSNEKRAPGWLGYIGDYTTLLYRDYNNPLEGSLLTKQYSGKQEGFFRCSPGHLQ